jgi:4-hydroxy 2-oxovalerate aldolase
MGKVYLLDCTLRDGGYVNDWRFGESTIKGFGKKIAQTGVEIYEVGFIQGDTYDKDRSVFTDIESIAEMIQPKVSNMMYVGMLDMGKPVPIEKISPCNGTSVDGLRVIFKKSKLNEACEYCEKIKELGYVLFVQLVGTDSYSDKEFIDAIERFNDIEPYALSIVDSFGLIKRKQFLRLVYLADNNLKKTIVLGYHAHNNLQQAFGNAAELVEMNLKRDVCIDACVFGMGRGAGNLNLELFAEYMNENYDANYRIEPMLEIMDEYLNVIYNSKFWGYSLPLYLSATSGCHPNYAIFLAEKDSLTVKSFNEILRSIPKDKKASFSKAQAENVYFDYQQSYLDDKETLKRLANVFGHRNILIVAPGKSLSDEKDAIKDYINDKNALVLSVNFVSDEIKSDYVFSSNMRRYRNIVNCKGVHRIITSNIKETDACDYVVNYSSYTSSYPEIVDNSGVMLIKLLLNIGITELAIAGMDGYEANNNCNYFDDALDYDFSSEAEKRNFFISQELHKLHTVCKLNFITKTRYSLVSI